MSLSLNQQQKKYIVDLAVAAIEKYFTLRDIDKVMREITPPQDGPLVRKGACFVTLRKAGMLRGCIGSVAPYRALYCDVVDNAVGAAFFDPRFMPLVAEEFPHIHTEVSVLTPPKPLVFDSPETLLKKLRPGTDGVILSCGGRRATFLPQVWEEIPDKEEFLAHLCAKAGLDPACWKEGDLDVETYTVDSCC